MRAELRGGLRAKLLRGGAVRAAGQVFAGRGGLRAMMWQNVAVRADCGPSYCGAGRAAGYDVANFAGRCGLRAKLLRGGAGCGLRFPARAGP